MKNLRCFKIVREKANFEILSPPPPNLFLGEKVGIKQCLKLFIRSPCTSVELFFRPHFGIKPWEGCSGRGLQFQSTPQISRNHFRRINWEASTFRLREGGVFSQISFR